MMAKSERTTTPRRPTLAWSDLRRVAVSADADPRTVKREIGTPNAVKGMAGERIRRALRELKLGPFKVHE